MLGSAQAARLSRRISHWGLQMPEEQEFRLDVPGVVRLPTGAEVHVEVVSEPEVLAELSRPAKTEAYAQMTSKEKLAIHFRSHAAGQNTEFVDLDALLRLHPVVRFRRDGDVFTNLNGGAVKLGQAMRSLEIAKDDRQRVPLVASGKNILLICGHRLGDQLKITTETTRVGRMSYVPACSQP
jgi:hypothetical protein